MEMIAFCYYFHSPIIVSIAAVVTTPCLIYWGSMCCNGMKIDALFTQWLNKTPN